MQAVVKKPHIEIKSSGKLPNKVVEFFKKEYGNKFRIVNENTASKYIDVTETNWYKEIKSKIKPHDYIRIYRNNANMTQEQLGKLLGKFTRQNISEMEKGKRGISKEVAKKLSSIFKKPVEKFI